ncbi:MAG: DUF3035 domain-containing protein [Pseudomonadota bacterium]
MSVTRGLDRKARALLILVAAGVALSGCAGLRKALGIEKNPPDEFAIVTKAPLVVPPDFALRPPRPGEARPQETRPEDRARAALFGAAGGAGGLGPTEGERLLVQKAGGFNADPNIRKILNAETGGLADKDLAFANRLIFWRVSGNEIDYGPAPLPAEGAEEWLEARKTSVEQATGGEQVTIEREKSKVLNLPGVF